MKCAMDGCTKKAQVQVSLSGSGESLCVCYKHGFMFVKTHMQRLGDRDFGIYVQRVPDKAKRIRKELTPEARENIPANIVAAIDKEDWNF